MALKNEPKTSHHSHREANKHKDKRRRHPVRPCGNPPAAPHGIVVTYRATEALTHLRFTAKIKWDEVTQDEQGHGTTIKRYDTEFVACNSSGTPVDTEDGNPRIHNKIRQPPKRLRLKAATNPTGTTFRFETRKPHGQSIGNKVKIDGCRPQEVYNGNYTVTALPTSHRFEVNGGASSVADCDSPGTVTDADDVLQIITKALPRPKTWYWKFRIRAVDKDDCAGDWSSWTTPTLPWTGADPAPPVPDTPTLDFDNRDKGRHEKVDALVIFPEVKNFDYPGTPAEDEDDLDSYGVQLDRSSDGVTWDGFPFRHHSEHANTDDAQTNVKIKFKGVRRHWWYRARARSIDRFNRKSEWSDWSDGYLPFDNDPPPAPNNVKITSARDRIVVQWRDPTLAIDTRGTVTKTSGGSTLVGVGTRFDLEVEAGSDIKVGTEEKVVKKITSNTSLTIVGTWSTTAVATRLKIMEPHPDVVRYVVQIGRASDVDESATPDEWDAVYDQDTLRGHHKEFRIDDDDEEINFHARVRSVDAVHNRSRWIAAKSSPNSDPDATGDTVNIIRDRVVVVFRVAGDLSAGVYDDQKFRVDKHYRIKRITGVVGIHDPGTHPVDGTPHGQPIQFNLRRILADESNEAAIVDTDSIIEIPALNHKGVAAVASGDFNITELFEDEVVFLRINQVGDVTRHGRNLAVDMVLVPVPEP